MTLTYNLLTLAMSGELSFACPVHAPIFLASYNYPFPSYVWLNLITLPSPGTVTAHAPCHVTYHWGKNDPHFWNPWTQFAYSLCYFYHATTIFKPCYRRKIAFSHCEGYTKLIAHVQYHVTCTQGVPKTTRNNFLTQNCLFTIQLLWGYDDD